MIPVGEWLVGKGGEGSEVGHVTEFPSTRFSNIIARVKATF